MDPEIDKRLAEAAYPMREVNPEVLDRITVALHSSSRPVRVLPNPGLLVSAVLLICAAVALFGAARSRLFGFEAMGIAARISVLCVLAVLAWLSARELVNQWIPGSRRSLTPESLVAGVSGALLLVFGLLFSDYRVEHFVAAGVVCLSVGVIHAAVAAGLAAWFLRRGYALNPVAAGAVAGALGGISGVAMLELHCPNLEAAHVLVWHVAVVPVSAVTGALIGWVARAWSDYVSRRLR